MRQFLEYFFVFLLKGTRTHAHSKKINHGTLDVFTINYGGLPIGKIAMTKLPLFNLSIVSQTEQAELPDYSMNIITITTIN